MEKGDMHFNKAVSLLNKLKGDCFFSLKAEFEAEGITLEDLTVLKELALAAQVRLTVKIGGCEAIRDLYDLKALGINSIVAPMIESAYALEKFVSAANSVFDDPARPELIINIETQNGLKEIENIIHSPYFSQIDGVTFGRSDFCASSKTNEVNSKKCLDCAYFLAQKMKALNKKFTIGGKICPQSVDFLKKVKDVYLTHFETRKIVFESSILKKDCNDAIYKAIEFEILWLQNKKRILKQDFERIKLLNSYFVDVKNFIESV